MALFLIASTLFHNPNLNICTDLCLLLKCFTSEKGEILKLFEAAVKIQMLREAETAM